MDTCTHIPSIGAYHDGELSESRQAEVEVHLAGCAECKAELLHLRQLSAAMRKHVPASLNAAAMNRLHRHVDALTDRSLLGFAKILSGVAAAMLVTASVWALRTTEASAEPLPAWERAAVTLQPETMSEAGSLGAAHWIFTELSAR